MADVDLFGDAVPAPTPVFPAPLHDEVQWHSIDGLRNAPRCGHCTMLVSGDRPVPIFTAKWRRTGRDGSVLDLCSGHRSLQRNRDSRVGCQDLHADAYVRLRDAIITTMEEPDTWDGDEPEADLLIRYVEWMSLKLHDINAVLDRDMT